jgi:hypothetical protein
LENTGGERTVFDRATEAAVNSPTAITFENNNKIRRQRKTENKFSLVSGEGNGTGVEPSLGLRIELRMTRAIGREVGCTTGTASTWRVRFAAHRLEGLLETGNRGATPKYTEQTDKRILSQLYSIHSKTRIFWSAMMRKLSVI